MSKLGKFIKVLIKSWWCGLKELLIASNSILKKLQLNTNQHLKNDCEYLEFLDNIELEAKSLLFWAIISPKKFQTCNILSACRVLI